MLINFHPIKIKLIKVKHKIVEYYYLNKFNLKRNIKNQTWVSLGENCLPDNILKRTKKKSFSTLFSSGRSNVDYIIDIVKNKYNKLLSNDSNDYCYIGDTKVVRSLIYNKCDPIFHPLHMNGFEFTHHDPLGNSLHKEALTRRVMRLEEHLKNNDVVFLYHHRYTSKSNIPLLVDKLKLLHKLFSPKKCIIALFFQEIVSNDNDRGIIMRKDNNILEFILRTTEIWEGDDYEIFWGKKDNDLIFEMISIIQNELDKNY